MMKKIKIIGFSFVAMAIVLIYSCQKNDILKLSEDSELKQSEILIDGISVKKGILIFKDWEQVYNTITKLEEMDQESFKIWENTLGFTSLKTLFNEFVSEENKMWDKLTKEYEGRENQLRKEDVKAKYENIVKKNKHSFTIVTMDDEGQYYDMNLYRSNLAPIVNIDGIVVIGDAIYRFTRDDERGILDGDWNKINELMKDHSKEVNYEKYGLLKNEPIDDPNCPRTISGYTANTWQHSMTDDNGYMRTIIYYKFLQRVYNIWDANCNYSTYTDSEINYTVRSLRKRELFYTWYENHYADIYVRYYHTGNNMATQTGWGNYPWTHIYHHTNSNTIFNTRTYTNHPNPTTSYIHSFVVSNTIGENDSKLTVTNKSPYPHENPGWPYGY